MFFISHTDIGDGTAAIIEIEGPLNSESAPDFDDYISKLLENNVIRLLIDMKEMSYISSEGIGAVLMLQKSINEKNGLVIFFDLSDEVSSLFKLLGFDKIFKKASGRAESLEMLDRHIELYPEPGTVAAAEPPYHAEHRHPDSVEPETSSEYSGITVEESDLIPEAGPEMEPEKDFLFDDAPGSDEEQIEYDSVVLPEPDDEFLSFDEISEELEPFVIECVKCKSLIRIKEAGEQLCPFCNTEFSVSEERKAVFKINDSDM